MPFFKRPAPSVSTVESEGDSKTQANAPQSEEGVMSGDSANTYSNNEATKIRAWLTKLIVSVEMLR